MGVCNAISQEGVPLLSPPSIPSVERLGTRPPNLNKTTQFEQDYPNWPHWVARAWEQGDYVLTGAVILSKKTALVSTNSLTLATQFSNFF